MSTKVELPWWVRWWGGPLLHPSLVDLPTTLVITLRLLSFLLPPSAVSSLYGCLLFSSSLHPLLSSSHRLTLTAPSRGCCCLQFRCCVWNAFPQQRGIIPLLTFLVFGHKIFKMNWASLSVKTISRCLHHRRHHYHQQVRSFLFVSWLLF